jgi:hypothetical protein
MWVPVSGPVAQVALFGQHVTDRPWFNRGELFCCEGSFHLDGQLLFGVSGTDECGSLDI